MDGRCVAYALASRHTSSFFFAFSSDILGNFEVWTEHMGKLCIIVFKFISPISAQPAYSRPTMHSLHKLPFLIVKVNKK